MECLPLSLAIEQRVPATMDAAIAAILELEIYLKPKEMKTHKPDVIAGVFHQRHEWRTEYS